MKRDLRFLVISVGLIALGAKSTDASEAKAPGFVVKEIRGGLYFLTDGAYNTMFLVSSEGVIAVDPLPTLGRWYLEAVASVTDRPITCVVYSHEHTDHIGAAPLFPLKATVVAQKQTALILAGRNDPRRPPPTVTFDDRYDLRVGDQSLILEYRGTNHSPGNLFIYAPRQKVLMLVDVVYPGYAPYPDLGVATDVPGYIEAHRQALAYEFTDFVGGHVDRIGSRSDVERSLEFVLDLRRTAEEVIAAKPFPAYLAEHPVQAARSTWLTHDDYENDLIAVCHDRLFPKWSRKLAGVERSLRSHCRTMIVGLAISIPPEPPGSAASEARP